jgi:hypothetical protein
MVRGRRHNQDLHPGQHIVVCHRPPAVQLVYFLCHHLAVRPVRRVHFIHLPRRVPCHAPLQLPPSSPL